MKTFRRRKTQIEWDRHEAFAAERKKRKKERKAEESNKSEKSFEEKSMSEKSSNSEKLNNIEVNMRNNDDPKKSNIQLIPKNKFRKGYVSFFNFNRGLPCQLRFHVSILVPE